MKYHKPVLLQECVKALNIKKTGIYIDATFGGGGHSKAILEKLTTGRLYAFDRDKSTIQNNIHEKRFKLINADYKYIKHFLEIEGVFRIDGLLADLGVSSHQIDTPERGFSFRLNGDLDMRMNSESKLSAYDVVNHYPQEKLANLLFEFGELYNSRRIAKAIIFSRIKKPLKTTYDLKETLIQFKSAKRFNQLLAQVFQAIRIEVNKELLALKDLLEAAKSLLNKNGRLVVISYHSIEDRLVKNFIKTGNTSGKLEKDFFGNPKNKNINAVNKRVIVAGEKEKERNPRSRSAKLRIAEKI